jgi:hypothetical protein
MWGRISAASLGRWVAVGGVIVVLLVLLDSHALTQVNAQGAGAPATQGRGGAGRGRGEAPSQVQSKLMGVPIPDISGIWDGTGRSHPVNSENVPWAKSVKPGALLPDGTRADEHFVPNFPELNERALAYQKVFDEAISPKYDCQPATPPAIEYDPYHQEILQWPDRVLIRYEKDDQLRTIWLDGRKPTSHDYGIQGISVGHYEGNALLVETSHYVFDVTGFDDYNGIPSSPQKKVYEKYWRDGDQLKVTVTVEDPMFLRKPASYTARFLPAPKGYKLQPFDCDEEAARLSIQFIPPRSK